LYKSIKVVNVETNTFVAPPHIGLHFISGLFKVGGWLKPTKPRGLVVGNKGIGMQGAGSTSDQGGIVEVVMLGFDLAWV
jgi:hypothetical protein